MPGVWGEAGGAEWEEWGVLGVQQLPGGVSVYVADGARVLNARPMVAIKVWGVLRLQRPVSGCVGIASRLNAQ